MKHKGFKKDNYNTFVDSIANSRKKTNYNYVTPELAMLEYESTNGLYAKICELPARDAMKNGYDIVDSNNNKIDDINFNKINEIIRLYNIDSAIVRAVTFSRAVCGSVILLCCDDNQLFSEELDLKNLKNIYDVRVYDATDVKPYTRNRNYNSYDFGKIIKYNITDRTTGNSFIVDKSRLIIFGGLYTSNNNISLRDGWGGCVLDNIDNALSKYNTCTSLSLSILSRLSQGVLKISGLMESIAAGQESSMLKYVNKIDELRSVVNSLVIDGNDDFELKNMTLSGYKDVIENFQYLLSSVSGIPITILFGRSPAGMNSTGDADLENYYSIVRDIQLNYIRSNYERLINIIANCSDYNISNNSRYFMCLHEPKMISGKDKVAMEKDKSIALNNLVTSINTLHEIGVIDAQQIEDFLSKNTCLFTNSNQKDE